METALPHVRETTPTTILKGESGDSSLEVRRHMDGGLSLVLVPSYQKRSTEVLFSPEETEGLAEALSGFSYGWNARDFSHTVDLPAGWRLHFRTDVYGEPYRIGLLVETIGADGFTDLAVSIVESYELDRLMEAVGVPDRRQPKPRRR